MDTNNLHSWQQALRTHYQKAWPEARLLPRLLDPNAVRTGMEGFAVLEIPPHPRRQLWTYATCGMSRPEDKEPLELHLYSPVQCSDHVELLTAVAHYHLTGAPLACWHTVNFGRPWMPGSQCDYGLISLPYLDGPALENGVVGGRAARFLWLIPITLAEREYKRLHGTEALETQFEETGFNYADPERDSTV